jgi:CheY-like chemotaxis protein/anti-sigma regulatory factor (Ser/Thr protein kinase)
MATILVVDDAGVDRTIAGRLIEKMGASVLFANNGAVALETLGRDHPDAVLTDLQMPELDGLQLVKKVRRHHPGIPVILMTAYGSEEIAVEALRAGAVSYVPKKNLHHDLVDALQTVLATVGAKEQRRAVKGLLKHHASSFELGYEPGSLAALVNHLQENLSRVDFADQGAIMQIGMALSEALTNAVDHGNLELDSALRESSANEYRELGNRRALEPPYRDRRVRISERISSTDVTYMVTDDGAGFDPTQLPDPTDPENLLKASGRGIVLIRTFMDEVLFSAKGNEITMTKRRSRGES